jgi:protein TonB
MRSSAGPSGARPPRPAGTDLLLLPLSAPFFSCLVEPVPAPILPVRPNGRRIVEPRKVLTVNPAYPQTAKEQRRQGVVILDALISPSGCITSVEVLRGVAPDLDAEALRAVTQWRYTPTLLEGLPVPVHMTVTVNFRLH